MTTEPDAPIATSAPARRSFRRAMVAAGVGATILLAGFGVAAAQTDDTPSPPPTNPPAAEGQAPPGDRAGDAPREGRRGGKPGGAGGKQGGRHGGPMGHAVHGSFVVPDGDGGFRTMEVQTGTVTAVSNSSITVKSADGFTRTYVVDEETMVNAGRDGIADVQVDDTVRLDAVVEGSASKARHIHDITTTQAIRRQADPAPPAPAG